MAQTKNIKTDGLNDASKALIALLENTATKQGEKLRAGYERGFLSFSVPVTAENVATATAKAQEGVIEGFALSYHAKTGRATARVKATTESVMGALNAIYNVEGSDEKADLSAVYTAIRHDTPMLMAFHVVVKEHLNAFGGQVLAHIGE